jgi:plasmid stabilization system protein ParE
MAQIRWTIQAAEDTETICKFIAKDAKTYARVFARNVFQAIKRLEKFPKLGRVVPELSNENIREIILGNYRIIYVDFARDFSGSRAAEFWIRFINKDKWRAYNLYVKSK